MQLLHPVISEKSAAQMDKGLYVFEVSGRATKRTITTELKRLFAVTADSIRIVKLPAKKVRFRRRSGTQAARHHAYVQLSEKQRLPGFELPKQEKK